MERMRWMSDSVPDNYFIVNIPEFRLHVFEDRKYSWSSIVVVGKAITATVIFSGTVSTVVFSPYWNIPPSIIKNEILPELKRNRNYLHQKDMEAVMNNGTMIDDSEINWHAYTSGVPFTIRQRPGKTNALGLVKFLFPNSYNIYMHDTPSKNFFQEDKRAFSHGCIRVAEAVKLANYVFRYDSTMTSEKIGTLMNSGIERFVPLKNAIPVFVYYFTAWVDHNGKINFRKDIYGHDAKLAKEIFGE
jgi:murein L,D-transpeptidase YcbB/YkuD